MTTRHYIEGHVSGYDWDEHVREYTEHEPSGDIDASVVEIIQEEGKATVTVSLDWSDCQEPLIYVATFVGPTQVRNQTLTGFCPEHQPRLTA